MQSLLGMLAEGRLRPLVSARYPLARTAAALTAIAERRATGKIVLEP
jgi:NADPH2:quinone reductase